ncbi:hypothetical protein QWZ10_20040 [Paracoccus cavernae]|uniref:Uncharacterized protein n=1 Tax=Paracoccus cavernae TaxID=1571207 RepID=A0ABT8DAE7_9RHOB|nr:hypothetical protein [Paracoccus cavernae]
MITTIVVAVGAAWVATDYTAEVLGVPEPVAAAIVTLTAEGAMRWLLMAVDNPKNAISISGSTGGAEISARGDRPCRAGWQRRQGQSAR